MEFLTKYEGPHDDADKLCALPVGLWRYQRPETNMGKCCHCGLCQLVCPTGCVEDKGHFFIADLRRCKGCGICSTECPVDAIYMVKEE